VDEPQRPVWYTAAGAGSTTPAVLMVLVVESVQEPVKYASWP
jgi:hypothetical protein